MSIYNMLYNYQKNIVDKFKNRKSFGIFLDMGLGKTPISLAFAEVNKCDKIIVITINSKANESIDSSGSWQQWCSKSSENYNILTKSNKIFTDKAEALIVNYESLYEQGIHKTQKVTLKKNISDFIKSCKNHNVAIIIDESHKVKSLQSMQTLSIQLIKKYLQLMTNNVYIYLLTGTPFTQGYIDLYSQLKLLGCKMNKSEFLDLYCIRGNIPGLMGWQQPIIGYRNIESLFDLVHKYAITIKSEEVIDLPSQIFINHNYSQTFMFLMFINKQVKGEYIKMMYDLLKLNYDNYYENAINHLKTKVNNPFYRNIDYPNENWNAETSGSFWLRARELSIGFQGNSKNAKWYDTKRLEMLENFLKDNENNYIIFYNYTPEMIEIYNICEKLGYNIDIYSGEIKSMTFYNKYCNLSDTEKLVIKKNVIITNFASGSTGMNWQQYSHCIIFSCPLYKDYAQGIKRIHRLGQKNTVFYHLFYQLNFLDNQMNKALNDNITYSSEMFDSDIKRLQQEIFEGENNG